MRSRRWARGRGTTPRRIRASPWPRPGRSGPRSRAAAASRAAPAAAPRAAAAAATEQFEPDDDVWAEAGSGREPPTHPVGSASVYDYSIVVSGWKVVVSYHVLVADTRGEPWAVRRTHAEFRDLVEALKPTESAIADVEALDDVAGLDRRHGAMNPRRFLSSRHLKRRVALLNALLGRIVADSALRDSEPFLHFIRPVPLRDVERDFDLWGRRRRWGRRPAARPGGPNTPQVRK